MIPGRFEFVIHERSMEDIIARERKEIEAFDKGYCIDYGLEY
jgi:hypothetical protein